MIILKLKLENTYNFKDFSLEFAFSEAHIGIKDTYERAAAKLRQEEIKDVFSSLPGLSAIDGLKPVFSNERPC